MYENRFTAPTRLEIRVGGLLDVGRERARRAAGGHPSQRRVERIGASSTGRQRVETLDRDGRIGERRRLVRIGAVRGEPRGDRVFTIGAFDRRERRRGASDARLHAVDRPRRAAPSVSRAAPRARDASSASASAVGQQPGAARGRRRRVVQLVRETGGELAERHHLLVLQLARSELPRAIEHHVDERRR